jgi:Flp pilus assembly protein TadB
VTEALLAGAGFGLGLLLLVRTLFPATPLLQESIARYDAARTPRPSTPRDISGSLVSLRSGVGRQLADALQTRGIRYTSVRPDLAVLGRSMEGFLATKALCAVTGLLLVPLLSVLALAAGTAVPLTVPLLGSLLLGAIGFVVPDLVLRQQAAERRRDFQHAVGSFVDLVALNMAGGRGVPEALLGAVSVGRGWAFARISQALAGARLAGSTPWQALGDLGEELAVDDLRELAASLTLVADNGAKVRESLSSRAASLRRRELTDAEGKAGEDSQSMLIAQLVLCIGFMIFLIYPAAVRVLQS